MLFELKSIKTPNHSFQKIIDRGLDFIPYVLDVFS